MNPHDITEQINNPEFQESNDVYPPVPRPDAAIVLTVDAGPDQQSQGMINTHPAGESS